MNYRFVTRAQTRAVALTVVVSAVVALLVVSRDRAYVTPAAAAQLALPPSGHAAPPSSSQEAPPPSDPDSTLAAAEPASRKTVRFAGTPTVGALFDSAHTTKHSSTASVIDSPSGDLLITAAHAIQGSGRGYVFVPDYHNGQEPYGAWTVTAAFASPAWTHDDDPSADVAFLEVAPQLRHGHLTSIEAVTGGHPLGRAPAAGVKVTVPAYAEGTDDDPFVCTTAVYYDGAYPAFDCTSYPGGTSGSPWLLDTPTGRQVVGVIGGLHQGGCTVATSYTAGFGTQIWNTYERAERGVGADTFPSGVSDGC